MKILLIDDHNIVREMVRFMMKDLGLTFVEAGSGEEALAQLEVHHDVALILCDYAMPEMNGAQFVKAIRLSDRNKTTPVIMLTANRGEQLKVEFASLNIHCWIEKPFSKEQLVSEVSKIVNT